MLFCAYPGNVLPELLGEPDEKSFGAADVAEPILVFVLGHFPDELRAVLLEPGERLTAVRPCVGTLEKTARSEGPA